MSELDLSRTYNFPSSFTFEKIVDKVFRRLQIAPNLMTNDFVESALDAANLEMRQWQSKHTALYLVQREMFTFVPGQVFYNLPSYVYKPIQNEAIKISFVRKNENGTASASSGVISGSAANCFSPLATTGLTQSNSDGWIQFSYNATYFQAIWYVGVLSLTFKTYTLNIEYSYDNVNWNIAKATPQTVYKPLETQWFVLESPPVAPYWRIRETGGSTLAIQQIFFNIPNPLQGDITIGRIGRASYLNYTNKINPTMTPSQIYFNEKINKSMYVYGNDYTDWDGIVYDAKVYPQDVKQLFQNVDLDAKFYWSLITGMSYQLSLEYPSPNIDRLKADYENVYNEMADDDGEEVPLSMCVNLSSNWSNL